MCYISDYYRDSRDGDICNMVLNYLIFQHKTFIFIERIGSVTTFIVRYIVAWGRPPWGRHSCLLLRSLSVLPEPINYKALHECCHPQIRSLRCRRALPHAASPLQENAAARGLKVINDYKLEHILHGEIGLVLNNSLLK